MSTPEQRKAQAGAAAIEALLEVWDAAVAGSPARLYSMPPDQAMAAAFGTGVLIAAALLERHAWIAHAITLFSQQSPSRTDRGQLNLDTAVELAQRAARRALEMEPR